MPNKAPKTRPWQAQEYVIVTGKNAIRINAVYTVFEKDEIVVHLPGGSRWSINSLLAHGFSVTMPTIMRQTNPHATA